MGTCFRPVLLMAGPDVPTADILPTYAMHTDDGSVGSYSAAIPSCQVYEYLPPKFLGFAPSRFRMAMVIATAEGHARERELRALPVFRTGTPTPLR